MTAECSPSILVVDDEPGVLYAMEDLFEDDYDVTTAGSGMEGLEVLSTRRFAVILSDQRMPGLTGDEFLREARKISDASRILVTGYAEVDALHRAVNEGQIYAYVAKPWEPEEIRVVVGRAADHFGLVRELHEERRLLRALMDNIPDAVYFKDTELRFIAANDTAARHLGLERGDDLEGRVLEEFIEPALAARIYRDEARILRDRTPVVDRLASFVNAGGESRWISMTKAPIVDRNGAVTGLVGINRDVDDRQQAEEALRASRERFRAVLDATPAMIYLKGIGGEFEMVNRRFLDGIGRGLGEVLGKTARDLCSPETAELLEAGDRSVRESGREESGLIEAAVRGGPPRHFHWVKVPVFDDEGRVIAICGANTDVTDRRRLEEQLSQSQKMDTIGQLTGGVAHDFNNLLTVILGNLQLMGRGLPDDAKLRRKLEIASRAAERGASLTRQLLAFARKQVLAPEVIDVSALLDEMQVLVKRTLGHSVRFRFHCDVETALVEVDPAQLESAILNLCINARDAMPEGGTVIIEASSLDLHEGDRFPVSDLGPGRYVVVEVSDTGRGMPRRVVDQIFEPFFTTKEKGKGTGLGLSMVYGFVRQSGGQVHVYSEEGIGTTFKIYLPASDREGVAQGKSPVAPEVLTGVETILVVEDDPEVRETAVSILEQYGYTVLAAASGAEALGLVERGVEFSLLFTDVLMPGGMNGPQLALAVHRLRPGMPVLFTSGFTANAIGEIGTLDAGCQFLSKPYRDEDVALKLRELLDRHPTAA